MFQPAFVTLSQLQFSYKNILQCDFKVPSRRWKHWCLLLCPAGETKLLNLKISNFSSRRNPKKGWISDLPNFYREECSRWTTRFPRIQIQEKIFKSNFSVSHLSRFSLRHPPDFVNVTHIVLTERSFWGVRLARCGVVRVA